MVIELTDICKAYGQKTVFDRFNCHIETGAVTCFMGQSGQGKTTLLRIILGLERPDGGHITGMSHKRKSVIFQEDRLCENISAAANIRLVCSKPVKLGSIIESMSAVGLAPDCVNQTARTMSGGQRRRVAILRALAADYDVLCMDEPFKGLDTEIKEKVLLYTKEQSKGKTVIFVTHDKTECEAMGGKVIYI
ncbi:MAG: ATP-binding cassette domain-containing protein [Treponema sp.]|nr:ATP-binding cassette domain-containing protein [Treponema sp.]